MKRITLLLLAYILLTSCSSNELSREKAEQIIRESSGLPKALTHEIDKTNPYDAAYALRSDLDESGYLLIEDPKKIENLGKELISFTGKASAYLLETPSDKAERHVQIVKLADENFGEITGIKTDAGGKSAIVEYTTTLINLTPFINMLPRKLTTTTITNKAKFELYDDDWRWVDKVDKK